MPEEAFAMSSARGDGFKGAGGRYEKTNVAIATHFVVDSEILDR